MSGDGGTLAPWPSTAVSQLLAVRAHWNAGERDPAAIAARYDVADPVVVRLHLETLDIVREARRTATRGD